MADLHGLKCPCCGGAIEFNSSVQKMKCPYCDTEFTIDADSVIFAIGLKPDKRLIENEGLELDEKGLIMLDENNMTNIEGVFAGGDVSQSKATVCKAIESGKKAAVRN